MKPVFRYAGEARQALSIPKTEFFSIVAITTMLVLDESVAFATDHMTSFFVRNYQDIQTLGVDGIYVRHVATADGYGRVLGFRCVFRPDTDMDLARRQLKEWEKLWGVHFDCTPPPARIAYTAPHQSRLDDTGCAFFSPLLQ